MALVGEATAIYDRIESGDIDPAQIVATFRAAMPSWVTGFLHNLGIDNLAEVRTSFGAGAADGVRAVLGPALQIGQSMFGLLLKLSVILYLAFFLIRDGAVLNLLVSASVPPLSDPLHTLVAPLLIRTASL